MQQTVDVLGQVRAWCRLAGFDLVEEGEGDGYHHFS